MTQLPEGTKLGVARLMKDLEKAIHLTPTGELRNLLADSKTTIALLWSVAKEHQ